MGTWRSHVVSDCFQNPSRGMTRFHGRFRGIIGEIRGFIEMIEEVPGGFRGVSGDLMDFQGFQKISEEFYGTSQALSSWALAELQRCFRAFQYILIKTRCYL